MIWLKGSEYHLRSQCDRYTVCKVYICGTVFMEAWRGKVFLAREESASSEGMRAVCEADLRGAAEREARAV